MNLFQTKSLFYINLLSIKKKKLEHKIFYIVVLLTVTRSVLPELENIIHNVSNGKFYLIVINI